MIRAATLCLALAVPAATAADPATTAERAAERLRGAAAGLAAVDTAEDKIGALTETIRGYEDGLGAFRDALRDAALRERAIRSRLDDESERLGRVLAALQTIERQPEVNLLVHPGGVLDTARAAMLMSDLVPALRTEVDRLSADLEEIRILGLLRRDAQETLQDALEGAQAARTALSEALGARTGRPVSLGTDEATLQALLNSADTLDAFASSLTGEASADTEGVFSEARGNIPLPVPGTLLRGFMEPDLGGIRRPGLALSAAPQALVTAPWPSTVRYAGPLLDYGIVMILEPEDGYLVVLAGLGDTFREVGEVVGAGEPLGLMGGQTRSAQEIIFETGEGGGQVLTETLYMELRAGDGPVDPADWFAMARE